MLTPQVSLGPPPSRGTPTTRWGILVRSFNRKKMGSEHCGS
jgi:hypothetical protein